MAPVVEKLLDGFTLAEGPHWDHNNQCLYFLDMGVKTIHKYVPSTKKHTEAKIGEQKTSIIIPVKGRQDEFLVTLDNSLAIINWDGESDNVTIIKTLCEVDQGTENVFNDGKCDKTGRVWAGTMGAQKSFEGLADKQGSLYSYENGIVRAHRNEVGISNGIAFDYEINKMYYIDSLRYTIDQYDVDFETGTLSNLKQIFHSKQHGIGDNVGFYGFDGMTIDSDGNLWVATFGTSRVYQINPRVPETILQVLELPAVQISSVTFGGPNLDELYVTSGNTDGVPKGESPGSLFRVRGLNVRGHLADGAVY